MKSVGQNRPPLMPSIVRDMAAFVLAAVLVLGLAWCLSRLGKAILSRLLPTRRPGDGTNTTTSTIDL